MINVISYQNSTKHEEILAQGWTNLFLFNFTFEIALYFNFCTLIFFKKLTYFFSKANSKKNSKKYININIRAIFSRNINSLKLRFSLNLLQTLYGFRRFNFERKRIYQRFILLFSSEQLFSNFFHPWIN